MTLAGPSDSGWLQWWRVRSRDHIFGDHTGSRQADWQEGGRRPRVEGMTFAVRPRWVHLLPLLCSAEWG